MIVRTKTSVCFGFVVLPGLSPVGGGHIRNPRQGSAISKRVPIFCDGTNWNLAFILLIYRLWQHSGSAASGSSFGSALWVFELAVEMFLDIDLTPTSQHCYLHTKYVCFCCGGGNREAVGWTRLLLLCQYTCMAGRT